MEKNKLNLIKGISEDEKENKNNKNESEDKEKKIKIMETKTENLYKTKLGENINDKVFIQGAFKSINNNYKNPAKKIILIYSRII